LWRINNVEWKQGVSPKELKSETDILSAQKNGELTNYTNKRISGGSCDLYVFTNGIKGTGPMGFQASIASTNVGDTAYSPLWRIQATTWKDPSHAEFLTRATQITSAAQAGKLSTNIAGVVVNCPIVDVHV
jgi:hypothetical protein